MFMSPSIDSFALVINSLFFVVLLRLAYEPDARPSTAILAACVGALAYANKLSYLYVPLALAGTGILGLFVRRIGWIRGGQLSILCGFTFVGVMAAIGFFIIGWDSFRGVLRYHNSIILGSGLYGTGDEVVVSGNEIRRALAAIPVDRAYAVFIALLGGAGLVVAGLVTALKRPQHVPAAIVSIGSGAASVLSALIVIKHYDLHYTAGVSSTLPASVVSGCLLAKSWGWVPRIAATAVAAIAILFMAYQTNIIVTTSLIQRSNTTLLAKADMQEIHARFAESKGAVDFAYRVPFPVAGEGFVIVYGSVPRLTGDYVRSRGAAFGSMTAGLFDREISAYIIDKSYFPTVESIKASSNLALLGPKPVAFKDGDKLIELRTVFILVPG